MITICPENNLVLQTVSNYFLHLQMVNLRGKKKNQSIKILLKDKFRIFSVRVYNFNKDNMHSLPKGLVGFLLQIYLVLNSEY